MTRRLSGAALIAHLVIAAPLFAKPPDLPQNPRITVAPLIQPCEPAPLPAEDLSGTTNQPSQPINPEESEGKGLNTDLREILTSSLFLNAHPFVAFWTGEWQHPDEPAGAVAGPAPSACPYLRQKEAARQVRVLGEGPGRSFMENLDALEKAAKGLEEARRLAQDSKFREALECLEVVRRLCPGSGMDERAQELAAQVVSTAARSGATLAGQPASPCCPVEVLLQTPVSFAFEGLPLSKALETITCRCGVPIVIDRGSLPSADGASVLDTPVSFHLDGMPLRAALDALLCPHHLRAEVKGCVVSVTAAEAPGQTDEPPAKCGSACPKCEELHAKHAGVAEQVNGLMKACYLAIGEGRFEKAADLAREAHGLDPARVEGDPLVYKMHLLAQKCMKGRGKKPDATPRCAPNDTEEEKPCQDPPLSLRPELPGVSSDVVPAMDAVLTTTDEPGKKDGDLKHSFCFGLDVECCGVSLEQVLLLLNGCFPCAASDNGLQLSLSGGGFSFRCQAPFNGVNYTVLYRHGVLLMGMTPEAKEE
jgi:hypothetical protein